MTILRDDTSWPATDGSPFPAAFATSHTTGGIDQIEANTLVHHSGTIGAYSDYNRAILNDASVNGVADLGVLIEWSWGNFTPLQDQGFWLFIRASNDFANGNNPATWVGFSVDTGGRTAVQHRLSSGSIVTDASGGAGTVSNVPGVANYLRAEVQGDEFRAKWWVNNVAEPAAWTHTASQTTSLVTAGSRVSWSTIGGNPAGVSTFTRIWKFRVYDFNTVAGPGATSGAFVRAAPRRHSRRR